MPDTPLPFAASLSIPVAFLAMWWWERRRPARHYPELPGWGRLGAGFFVLAVLIGSAVPLLLALADLQGLRVFDLSALGGWGVIAGLLVTTLVRYAWHRAEHRFDTLWRIGHQLHHSPQRVDMPGAYFTHPLDVALKTAIGVLVGTVLLGLAPAAASATTLLVAGLGLFQHWNVRTPRWLGWLLPRPEMHALHHERGVHGRNYGDLPLWDLLFGTWVNPPAFDGCVGFDDPAAGRLRDMLLMRDAHAPAAGADRSA
jgi:sterol desaturase/sphingolipid hydroxylase (fatty acid hydroxylase superfamily)